MEWFEAGSVEWSLIRPRKIGLPSTRPILVLSCSVRWVDRGLVRRSTSWSWLWTWWTFSMPFWAISRTKCRSIWMCFIRECWMGLRLSWVAPKLSQSNIGGEFRDRLSSWNRDNNQMVSEAAFARALYSASVDDLATTRCYFELQDIGLEPRKQI